MKEPKAPKYFAIAHTICLLAICVVNVLDIYRITKSEETFMLINHAQVLSLLFILPALFIATIVILFIYRKNIISNMLAMLFNIITWLFVISAFAVKF